MVPANLYPVPMCVCLWLHGGGLYRYSKPSPSPPPLTLNPTPHTKHGIKCREFKLVQCGFQNLLVLTTGVCMWCLPVSVYRRACVNVFGVTWSMYGDSHHNYVECVVCCTLYKLFTPPSTPPHTGYNCLRASPAQDYTNGFFVALFERDQSSKDNFLEVGGSHASLTHPSHGDMPASHEDTHSVQVGTPAGPCGPVRQRFRGGPRYFKRRRIQLALCRRLSHRRALHCKKLFHPSYVLYPKYRCYYNVCT